MWCANQLVVKWQKQRHIKSHQFSGPRNSFVTRTISLRKEGDYQDHPSAYYSGLTLFSQYFPTQLKSRNFRTRPDYTIICYQRRTPPTSKSTNEIIRLFGTVQHHDHWRLYCDTPDNFPNKTVVDFGGTFEIFTDCSGTRDRRQDSYGHSNHQRIAATQRTLTISVSYCIPSIRWAKRKCKVIKLEDPPSWIRLIFEFTHLKNF